MDVLSQVLHFQRMKVMTLESAATTAGLRVTRPVGIIRCEPVWELKPYVLNDFLLWCVLDGVGTAGIAGRELPLGPGTCLLLPPGAALTAHHDPRRPLRVFYLHLDLLDSAGRPFDAGRVTLPAPPVVIDDLAAFEPLARQVVAGHAAGTPGGQVRRDLALRLMLLQIASTAERPLRQGDDSRLTAALQTVQENPGRPWTAAELAAQAGLSVSQAARRIRRLTGRSPQEFVIRARIARARRLMLETPLSLKQIAESLGYTDVYFFHRQFKAVTGTTPGRWRRGQ